jgi:hypothetical protein
MKTGINRRTFLKASAVTGTGLIGANFLGGREQLAYGQDNEIKWAGDSVHGTYEAEVVVIGGGPGGFAAALRAARMGASVIMIEKYDMPGGVHTCGLQGAYSAGVGGIHTELMQNLVSAGQVYTATDAALPGFAGNPLAHYDSSTKVGSLSRSTFNPEECGNIMLKMLDTAGVKAMYGTTFLDVVMNGNTIRAIIVQNASGTQRINGQIFIDGSGTAEVAARSGAPFVQGGGPQPSTVVTTEKNWPIPGGVLWIMTGINFEEVVGYQTSHNDPTLSKAVSAALAAGDIPANLYRPRLSGTNVYGSLYIGHPTVDMSPIQGPGTFIFWENVPYEWHLHMDDSAADMARAKVALREFVYAESQFLKKYVPGFENAFVTNVGRYLGIRDGRHPIGRYVFSINDALQNHTFPDTVITAKSVAFQWEGGKVLTFEVPYRCFLPRNVNNLLLTGASMSFTYETIFYVMRGFAWCMQTGEIAGFAAAQSLAKGIPPDQYQFSTPLFCGNNLC